MGRAWKGTPSWAVVEAAEDAVGESLSQLVLDAPESVLARTRDAQLAVLLTSLMAWDAARDRLAPHAIVGFAGHSLGQVTALIAAGALDLADGVRFAARRADATQLAADANPGRMAALLGASTEQADAACDGFDCWVANDNAPGQVVIAGTPDGLDRALARARELGVRRAAALKVGGAFHTPLMGDATGALRDALQDVELRVPSAPVVSNADAAPHADGEGWRRRLVEHLTRTVRWRESMVTLAGDLSAGAFVEAGHGSMIGGVARRTVPGTPVVPLATPDDVSRLESLEDLA